MMSGPLFSIILETRKEVRVVLQSWSSPDCALVHRNFDDSVRGGGVAVAPKEIELDEMSADMRCSS